MIVSNFAVTAYP